MSSPFATYAGNSPSSSDAQGSTPVMKRTLSNNSEASARDWDSKDPEANPFANQGQTTVPSNQESPSMTVSRPLLTTDNWSWQGAVTADGAVDPFANIKGPANSVRHYWPHLFQLHFASHSGWGVW